MKTLFLFLGCAFLFFSCSKDSDLTPAPDSTGMVMSVPDIRVLSELPDSLQPAVIALSERPSPPFFPVSYHSDQVVSVLDESGNMGTRTLYQPEVQHLPYLMDENGSPIVDSDGRPFIAGDGGVSQFKNFSTDQGLALDAVNCAVLDSRGQLWFGTNGGGISRFDGVEFTSFTTTLGLSSNTVRSMLEDSRGVLWVGTVGGGVSSYDGNVFTNYTVENGLADDVILSILEDEEGNLWFGTYGSGVSKYNRSEFTTFNTENGLPDDVIVSMAQDQLGNIWFGTNGGGVAKFDGSQFITFTMADGLPSNRIRSIYAAEDGQIWFGTIGGGVSRYDGKSFHNYGLKHGLPSVIVRAIVEDEEHDIWLATENGVSRFDGGHFTSYTREQGLPSNSILDVVKDGNGKLWFCTDGGGVSRFGGRSFTNFTTAQGLADNIVLSSVQDQQGSIWFGTASGGVSKFDGKAFTSFGSTQGLAGEIVSSSLLDRHGELWFGTNGGGVSHFNGEGFRNYTVSQGLPVNEIYHVAEDSKGNLWFGTDGGGVSKFDGAGFTNYTAENGLAGDVILNVVEDSFHKIWFGAADGGLSRFDGLSFVNFSPAQGLADYAVIRLVEDSKGNLWIGTENGLSFLSHHSLRKMESISDPDEYRTAFGAKLFETFTLEDGLPDNVILQIAELPNGKMAVGSNQGIVLFDSPADSLETLDSLRNLEIFNTETGFPVKDLVDGQNGMFVDKSGVIWAGTGNTRTALVRFDPRELKRNTQKPELIFKELRINEEVISWHSLSSSYTIDEQGESVNTFARTSDELIVYGKKLQDSERQQLQDNFKGVDFDSISSFYPIPQELVLPYSHNNINIDFGTNELAKPSLVEYQFMLDGYDDKWSPILKRTTANYGNIPEGSYTLNVRARFTGPVEGDAGAWTAPIQFSFEVLPPWYRTWWAFLIYSLAIVFLIFRLYIYQRNKLIKQENEKAKERELEHAKAIEVAYTELAATHENLKGAQAQLVHSEKMASLGELMAGIAHEIQNPLNFVNNFSEVTNELVKEIKEEVAKPAEIRDVELEAEILDDIESNLEKINKHGKRAGAIVKGMLQHSRSGKGIKELTNLNALSEEYMKLAFHGLKAKESDFNADFETQLDDDAPKIEVVVQDIGRVLLNVFNNAFYACAERAKALLPSQHVSLAEGAGQVEDFQPKVTLMTKKIGFGDERKGIQILISDNGKGIPKSVIDKIFQPFFTTKPTGQGTGLGLSLSYDIIKAHGGEISVKSTENEGTTFTINLYASPLAL
ncbi:ATP-binding protein [Algoriphagus halophytocola]|uniref:histidine kinase n=1 Tax=Algoriphagus halophytocola TaxID=2991499 RepID=A0ABY6MG20_9BACT|nr:MULTISPECIES: two-component regulator propeller domain-containing protein [unclassified Algoriphagus]UZD21382.1 ATP-binding protein [Algoriphagus sp. TR-M5]WBL42594.1 ATP-binding protein [Algoriphagus sp. TR-M9]